MEIVIRITVIYLFVLVGLHLIGKREFGQLSPFELVTLLLIPEIASQSLTMEDASVSAALIGIATLFSLVFVMTILTYTSKKAENLIEGQPAILVGKGRMIENVMHRERVNPDEIFVEMHKAGLERLEQVR